MNKVALKTCIAKICLFVSSLFNAIAKALQPGVIAVSLPLPGWFILHDHIIKQTPLKEKLFGFQWNSYKLPDEWSADMRKLWKK